MSHENEDLIPLPEIAELKETIAAAKIDLKETINEIPELAESAKLIEKVMSMVEEKIKNHKDLTNLSLSEKIDIAAYINFLELLLDEFFFNELEEEYSEFDDEDEDEDALEDASDNGHHHHNGCCHDHQDDKKKK